MMVVNFVTEWNLNKIAELSSVSEVDYYKVMMNINDLKGMKILEINKSAMTSYSFYRYWYDNWVAVFEIISNTLNMFSVMRLEVAQALIKKVNMQKVNDGLECLHTYFVKRNDIDLRLSIIGFKHRLNSILSSLDK